MRSREVNRQASGRLETHCSPRTRAQFLTPLPSVVNIPHAIFLVAQMIKHLPTMQETCVQSLGQEDLLEKEMAPRSSTLAWRIPWTEEPGGLQSTGSQRVRHDWATSFTYAIMLFRGEGRGESGFPILSLFLNWSIVDLVPISAVQQSDSVIHINILFYILFHYVLAQDIKYITVPCAIQQDLVVCLL